MMFVLALSVLLSGVRVHGARAPRARNQIKKHMDTETSIDTETSMDTETSGDLCLAQWNNQACTGQFGNEQCSTCGQRITWLVQNAGMSNATAKLKIGEEFFGPCGGCGSQVGITLQTTGYTVVWRDDFNSINTSNWRFVNAGGGFGNNELQYYTNRATNAFVTNGILTIRAKREAYSNHRFTSAKLESIKNYRYGKFTFRGRFPNQARGTWAALWMMPQTNTYGTWPRSGEIDIMEHVGYDRGHVHGTVHTQAYNHMIGTQRGGSIKSVDLNVWHTYTCEWRPDIILFAIDGKVYQIFRNSNNGNKDQWPFDHSFYLIMNMAVGGNWGGVKGIDEVAFDGNGQIMEIDWFTAEQRSR